MKKKLILSLTILCSIFASAQDVNNFTTVAEVPATSVKNQASSGTCWCFASASFFESELLRTKKEEYDLSEMFIVRQKYLNQLNDNYIRNGKGNLGQGSLSHTFINAFNQVGIVPESVYHGINYDSPRHSHGELNFLFQQLANASVKMKSRSKEYYKLVNSLFDIYLGKLPTTFNYKGKEYTPKSFAKSLDLDMNDYVEITSFTHHPFYEEIPVEVPDNWEHKKMYNVPLNELTDIMDRALKNGYSICWDGDVSEAGFNFRKGIATNIDNSINHKVDDSDRANFERKNKSKKNNIALSEITTTQENRQEGFEKFKTTDDHLMHIVGLSKDENGNLYYITKNSWGTARNPYKGYLHMSANYVKAKTIYILIHKDALSKEMKKKLNL